MPVDSNGNIGYYKNSPPISMGRKNYRKWLKKTYGTLDVKKISKKQDKLDV